MACKAQQLTDRWAVYNGDCIEGMATLPSESVHLSIYSPPFAGLYRYSSDPRDLSNSRTYEEFLAHYEFVVAQIARVTMPGRISAVHCMDVPLDGANVAGYRDFPGDVIRLHARYGFDYLPRICIWKEPLAVRLRTMAKALEHRQIVNDSTRTNVAAADYLIPFRKKGVNPVPVIHPVGLTEYAGLRKMPQELHGYRGWQGDQTENRFSHWIWRQYASCFWDDIDVGDVLPYEDAGDPEDESHPHPLQLQVIDRACVLWSNPGEIVLTPFAGVGSEVFGSVRAGRKACGWELKSSYYAQLLRNLAAVDEPRKQQELPLTGYQGDGEISTDVEG